MAAQSSSRSVNPKSSKKTWLILGIILGVLLIPLVVLDVRYRMEFAEYDSEVKRIASFLPEGTVEKTIGHKENSADVHSHTRRGNGLVDRLLCFPVSCPIVSRSYLVKVESGNEVEVGRETMRRAGYSINPDYTSGAPLGVCEVIDNDDCWIPATNSKYYLSMTIASSEEQREAGVLNYRFTLEP